MVPDLATRSNLARYASDIDLTRILAPAQVVGSWTKRINMHPEVQHDKNRARAFPLQKAASSNNTAVEPSPTSKAWIRQFRHKWRQEQLRSRFATMRHSPTVISSASSGMPDDGNDHEDSLVFDIDDIDGDRPSVRGQEGSHHAAAAAATATSRTECSPMSHQEQWPPRQHTWTNGPSARTLQGTVTRPVAIKSRTSVPGTALQEMHRQRLLAQQQQALRQQQPPLQQPHQQQPPPQQLRTWEVQSEPRLTEVRQMEHPKLSTVTQAAKEKNSAGSGQSSSTVFVSTAKLQPPRLSASRASRPQAQTDESAYSASSLSGVSETTAAPCNSNRSDQAALPDIAGLAPVRRAVMRGSSGKLKPSVRLYKAELPPQYSRASQAA